LYVGQEIIWSVSYHIALGVEQEVLRNSDSDNKGVSLKKKAILLSMLLFQFLNTTRVKTLGAVT
jgi:hypothetical protein